MQIVAIFVIFAICAAAVAAVFISLARKDREERNRYAAFYDYHTDLDPEAYAIVTGGETLRRAAPPEYTGGVLYIPHDYVAEYIDPYLFWEPWSGRLTVTNGERVYKFSAGQAEYTINFYSTAFLEHPIYERDGVAYIPEGLLRTLYNTEIEYNPFAGGPKLVTVRDVYDGKDTSRAVITAETARLRYAPGPKEPIYQSLAAGAEVLVFGEPVEAERETYIKVRSVDGVLGYVLEEELGDIITEPGKVREPDTYRPPIAETGGIVIGWQVFGSAEASGSAEARQTAPGLDVLSPTWFSFDDSKRDGTIIDYGSVEYSRWAHSQGLQVWGLITDNFSYEMSNAILTNTEVREKVVRSLIEYAAAYEMDGINIDFEMVSEADSKHYIQFLRELYPPLKERGLVLSVDMYVPSPWNMYYNRAEIAKTSDFLIVMGYDEHWDNYEIAGPNASINFVRNGITASLEEVPPEKLILGIPFFVRRWREETNALGATVTTSSNASMDHTRSLFENHGAEFEWDAVTAHYYAEYTSTENGTSGLNKVWLEDARSMEEKLKLAVQHSLAGVAAWRMGYESPGIWDVINRYILPYSETIAQ
jgi:spore germination protein YaaH